MRSDLFSVHFLVSDVFKKLVWRGFLNLDQQLLEEAATVFFAHRPNDQSWPFQRFLVENVLPKKPELSQTSWYWPIVFKKIKAAETETELSEVAELARFLQNAFGEQPFSLEKLETDNVFLTEFFRALEFGKADFSYKKAVFEGLVDGANEFGLNDLRLFLWAIKLFDSKNGFFEKGKNGQTKRLAAASVEFTKRAFPALEKRFGRDVSRWIWEARGAMLFLHWLGAERPKCADQIGQNGPFWQTKFELATVELLIERLPHFLLKTLWANAWGDQTRAVYEHILDGKTARDLLVFTRWNTAKLSPRAAHILMTGVPFATQSIADGIVWAHAKAILQVNKLDFEEVKWFSRLRTNWIFEPFFEEMVCFFSKNEAKIPSHQIQPLLDFFVAQLWREPHFSLRGRTAESVFRLMEAWHLELAAQKTIEEMPEKWVSSRLCPFMGEAADGHQSFRILEITEAVDLIEEGRVLQHCVASYARKCAENKASIWSLRLRGERLVTIEVARDGQIVQARGLQNRMPTATENAVIGKWGRREKLFFG